jgi:hypothetical protein
VDAADNPFVHTHKLGVWTVMQDEVPQAKPARVPRDIPIVHPTGPRRTNMPARYAGNGDSTSDALRARGDVEGKNQVRRRASSAVHVIGTGVEDGPSGGGALPPRPAPQLTVAPCLGGMTEVNGADTGSNGGDAAGLAAASQVVNAPAAAPGQPEPTVAASANTQLPRPSAPQVRGCTGPLHQAISCISWYGNVQLA